ncbi:Large T antigen [Pumfec polyomavirus LSF128]|nr:Large T antigen [Pumfec polyomavirus LSF128]
MDGVLSSAERRQLCSLLDLAPNHYGNIPLMKSAYKKACLRLHPDKGGDPTSMMTLNALWHKFTVTITELRSPNFQEDPIYGTPHFRAWWFRKHYGFFPEDHNPYAGNRRSRHRSSAGEGTSGGNIFTPKPPRSNSSRTNLFGNSASQGSSDGDPLFCEETLDDSSSETEEDATEPDGTPGTESGPTDTPDGTPGTPRPMFGDSGSTSASSSHAYSSATSPSPSRKRPPTQPTSPSSGASFRSTPPKPKKHREDNTPVDFPDCLSDCLSNATLSNKTHQQFLIYTTQEKGELLYNKFSEKYKVEFCSLHSYKGRTALLFLVLLSKHRVSAIKNFAATFCSVSFLLCKAVNKPPELYLLLGKPPFCLVKENKPGLWDHDFVEPKDTSCNWNTLTNFACTYGLDDPMIILAHYLDFATPPGSCAKCKKPALKAHEAHHMHYENAKLFLKSKSQKSACQQAADVVIAKNRLKMAESSREDLLKDRMLAQLKKLQEMPLNLLYYHLAGVAWYKSMFLNFEHKVMKVLQLLCNNIPKKRNCLFRGPINSGKTSMAAAFIDLLDGRALNINCPQDKLNFELGCAQDMFMVCFEDVKGPRGLNKELPPGQGISNLDNLRDHLDGSVPVNLERKHQNKRSQVFPPSITTSNDYVFPETVLCRFALTLTFTHKPQLKKALDNCLEMQKHRVLQKGATLLLGLIWFLPLSTFDAELRDEIKLWKEAFQADIPEAHFDKMMSNIEQGLDPLNDLFEGGDAGQGGEGNEDADSGRFTQ